MIEAGEDVDSRFCTVQELKGCRKVNPCQVTSGIGGASGLAGGKLSEYPAGRALTSLMGDSTASEIRVSRDLLASYMTMIGSDVQIEALEREQDRYREMDFELRHYPANKYSQAGLKSAWSGVLQEARIAGVEVRLQTKATYLNPVDDGVEVTLEDLNGVSTVYARAVLIATGRTGSQLISTLPTTAPSHAVDIGVRIEFPADKWPELDSVHGDLKLHFGNARTFCASKSGWISPYRHDGVMLLEGRTDSEQKSKWSNLAVSIRTVQDPTSIFAGVRDALLQQGPGSSIRQPLSDYLANRTSVQPTREPESSFSYWRWGDVNALLPDEISRDLRSAVDRFTTQVLPSPAAQEAFVFGPELDYYWATVAHRDQLPGVWSAGDVTGEYRGTLQAFTAGRYMAGEISRHLSFDWRG
jgi:uncharacterized FAD-dependent dehydrogenase